jgi:hypothetical protein
MYGERRGAHRLLMGRPEGKIPLGRSGVDGKITLELMFKKWDRRAGTGMIWLRIRISVGML